MSVKFFQKLSTSGSGTSIRCSQLILTTYWGLPGVSNSIHCLLIHHTTWWCPVEGSAPSPGLSKPVIRTWMTTNSIIGLASRHGVCYVRTMTSKELSKQNGRPSLASNLPTGFSTVDGAGYCSKKIMNPVPIPVPFKWKSNLIQKLLLWRSWIILSTWLRAVSASFCKVLIIDSHP